MKPARAAAPGKAILLGEHAVVYGRPALAVPVTQVQASAALTPGPGAEFWIELPAIGRRYRLSRARPGDPLAAAVRLVLDRAGLTVPPGAVLRVESTIPIAAGLGSGAAVCTAVARALAGALELPLGNEDVSALVFETEKLLHGTPSGIDNTVVAHARPVYFVKGRPPEPFEVRRPVRLLIGDTGRPSPTRAAVADVRAGYARDRDHYNRLFDEIGALVERARALLAGTSSQPLGPLLTANHALLRELQVSSPELEALVAAAGSAGAEGAKLSGGGHGGNMLALVTLQSEPAVRAALLAAGAARVFATQVDATQVGATRVDAPE
ncbi:MAG: mevalonate kinase [Anaerolineales bacterium]|nr:mevalonate kinase [Anaerolineales bacterium]